MNTPPDPIPTDLQRWLDEQADGAELAHVWRLAGHAAPQPAKGDAVEAAWSRVEARLSAPDQPRTHPEPSTRRRHPRRRDADRAAFPTQRALWVGASLTLVGAFVLVAIAQWGGRSLTIHADAVATALTLPDGSPVTLAPGSSLTYRRAFHERAVALVGQAHFEVTPGQSFTVETFNAQVAVLGTAFDVRAWPAPQAPDAAETAVVVFEGRVALRARGTNGGVELAVGERGRLVGSTAHPERVAADLDAADAWRHATFAAYDTPLAGVVAQIERQFGTRVRLGGGVHPARRVTALLPQADSAEAVLADVAAYLGYRLDRRPDGTFDLR